MVDDLLVNHKPDDSKIHVSTVTFYAWKRRFREAPLASPLFLIGPRPGPPGFFFVGTYFRLFGLCTVGNRKMRLLYAGTAAACFPPNFRSSPPEKRRS